MASLSEVYEPDARFQTSLRRLYAGMGLFCLGALLVVAGIVTATTNLVVDGPLWAARELGGVLAGLGVPAVFVGIFAVLPARRQTRAAALVGASLAVLGVALFWHAFPCQWSGSTCGAGLADLTLPTVGVYFVGTITTFWCLFVAVANFKARNNPGGTVTMEVTRKGETQVVEVSRADLGRLGGVGGVGFLGGTPDADVETQTNRGGDAGSSATVSDGGDDDREVTEVSNRPTATGGGAAGATVARNPRSDRNGGSTTGSAAGSNPPARTASGSSTANRSTHTDRPTGTGSASSAHQSGNRPAGGTGGSARSATGGVDRVGSSPKSTAADRYCGSCAHFEYVRTEEGMMPYCGFHDALMDDMSACEEWTSRS